MPKKIRWHESPTPLLPIRQVWTSIWMCGSWWGKQLSIERLFSRVIPGTILLRFSSRLLWECEILLINHIQTRRDGWSDQNKVSNHQTEQHQLLRTFNDGFELFSKPNVAAQIIFQEFGYVGISHCSDKYTIFNKCWICSFKSPSHY